MYPREWPGDSTHFRITRHPCHSYRDPNTTQGAGGASRRACMWPEGITALHQSEPKPTPLDGPAAGVC